jgi:hypothetical protein
MATTTNYNWSTPDDTSLVKDGAAAIRTLGSSIDTTTKALNPSTTLGDIEYRSSTANTNTRLGIGSTGQVLTVSGGVPAWSTPATPSSGMTLISRTSFTSQATVNIDNVFTTSYKTYLVALEGVTASTGSDDLLLLMRYTVGGPGTITSGYYGTRADMIYNSSTITGNGINGAASFIINNNTGDTAGHVFFNKVGGASAENPIFQGTTYSEDALTSSSFMGSAVSGSVIAGFQLKSSSTNITGTVAVYGLAIA